MCLSQCSDKVYLFWKNFYYLKIRVNELMLRIIQTVWVNAGYPNLLMLILVGFALII